MRGVRLITYDCLLILIFLLLGPSAQAQELAMDTGKISFVTGLKLYAKFANTENISQGDTIWYSSNNEYIPLFKVDHKSSRSVVGEKISKDTTTILPDLMVFHFWYLDENQKEEVPSVDLQPSKTDESTNEKEAISELQNQIDRKRSTSKPRFRVQLSSNGIKDDDSDRTTLRSRASMSFRNDQLWNSKFGLDAYISYRKLDRINSEVTSSSIPNSTLRIFSLALKYHLNPSTTIILGRRVSNDMSNIGAIDGLQVTHENGDFKFGGVIGTRPALRDYSINFKQPQFGAFITYNPIKNKSHRSTLSFFQLHQSGNIDRRFVYFQHSSQLYKGIFLFANSEVDLYKKVKGETSAEPRLTSIYASLRYRINRNISIFFGYDHRLGTIFYETYKDNIESLLDIAARYGYRARLNFRIFKRINLGISGNYRSQKNSDNYSQSLYNYIRVSRVPFIKASLSLSANVVESNYLEGTIYSIRLNRDVIRGKLSAGIFVKKISYKYGNSGSTLDQEVFGTNLNWRMNKSISSSLYYERSIRTNTKTNRLNVNLLYRFVPST